MSSNLPTIVFLTDSFSTTSGGRTASIFRRAKLFKEMGHNVCIATVNFKPNYRMIFDSLCEKYSLIGANFHNMYEFFSEGTLYISGDVNDPSIDKDIKKWTSDLECEHFDLNERLMRRRYIRRKNSGNIVKEVNISPEDNRNYLVALPALKRGTAGYLWNKKDGTSLVFQSEIELHEYWLSEIEKLYDKVMFFEEYHSEIDQLLNNRYMEHKPVVISMVHRCIFDEPYTETSNITEYYDGVLSRANEYDAIVVLNEQVKRHIDSIYGRYGDVHVIPHPLEQTDTVENEHNSNRIVICSRLIPLKRINDILAAFKLISEEINDVEMQIYGEGPSMDDLTANIEELGLNDRVYLMGFTDSPLNELSKAALTFITSESEGFSFSIYEALSVGTPVIAYDFLYGPETFIKDGINGYIVENGNVAMLAEKAIFLLKNREELEKMSKNARATALVDTREDLKNKWDILFKKVLNHNERETNFKVESVEVVKSRINSFIKWRLSIEADVKFSNRPDKADYYLNYGRTRRFDLFDALYTKGKIISQSDNVDRVRFVLKEDKESIAAIVNSGMPLSVDVWCDGNCTRFILSDKDVAHNK